MRTLTKWLVVLTVLALLIWAIFSTPKATATHADEAVATSTLIDEQTTLKAPNIIPEPPIERIKPIATADEQAVIEDIRLYARMYGAPEETMIKIAKAESRFKNVENYKYTDEKGTYTAYGIFMILRSTYTLYCGEDPLERMIIDRNIRCAMVLATQTKAKLHHWDESSDTWNKL